MNTTLTRNEELLLLAVWRLQDKAYGLAIKRDLERLQNKEINIAAVYIPLARLTKRGLLETRESEPTARRGGRRKKYYRLTPQGLNALNAMRAIYEQAWTGLPRLSFNF